MIKDGLTLMLQRRALQLPGAAGRSWPAAASGSRRNSDTEVVLEAWRRWGPGRAAPVPRHVRVRAARRRRPASWSWPATRSASSRCTSCPGATASLFASELKALVAAVGPELRIEPGALVASMLYYWVPEQCLRDRGRPQAPGRARGPGCRPDGTLQRRALLARRRRSRPRPRAGPRADLRPVIEESVAAHLVADVPVSQLPQSGGLDSSIVTVLAHRRRPRRSTPTRSPSGPRTSAWRPCPTTRSTPARWPRSSASSCTRSRSRPDIVDLLPRMVDVARRADRRPGRDQHAADVRGGRASAGSR